MTLRDGTFALFLAGQYNTATKKAFVGTQKQGACASYVSFHNMTHFGMNDFVAPSDETHQAKLLTFLQPGFQSICTAMNMTKTRIHIPCLLGEHEKQSIVLARICITELELSKNVLYAKADVMLSVSPHKEEPGDETSHD